MLAMWIRPSLYASGNFGKNILWNTTEVLLLFVFTELLGINPAVAGGVILCSLLLDAAFDPLIGFFADRLRTPIGQFGPLMLVGAPLAASSFIILMSLPFLGRNELWIVLPILLIFRLGYTLVDVPHNSLLARSFEDSRQRSHVAGLRFFFSSIAALVLALVIAPLISVDDGLSPIGLAQFALFAAAASTLFIFVSWLAVRRSDIATMSRSETPICIASVLVMLSRNPNFLTVLTLSGIAALSLPLFAKSQLYLTRYVLEVPELASLGLLSMIIGQFLGLPFWMWLAEKRENSTALTFSHFWLLASSASFLLVGTFNAVVYLMICASIGVAASGIYSVIWAMFADCVEDGQIRSGQRVEGTLFAIATFVQKSMIGLGAAVFGVALSVSGYNAGDKASWAVEATIMGIAAGVPIIGSLICLLLLRDFRFSHDMHTAVAIEINSKFPPAS